ncbi:restriction endonuclease subunit S [Aliarcobacter skirrowii]|uniref:restriction endonuclease subunit S n=1 Tax=Aliarcobacter skirrowii TaxID=28200 RepID=UPI002A3715B9|nr:restriction endonuclease subunit S [Aliarcobacter skirrowii]MDY0180650.1 restriction endonuclease subunit S [Aliarcobacter skirrowii]
MAELYTLPDGWEWKNITEITDLITCGVAKKPDYVKEGYPFLSAKNVKEFNISLDDFQYVSEDDFLSLTKHNKPLNGDILYSRVGSFGEAALIDFDMDFTVYVSLTLIKVSKEKLNNKFMVYLLNSPYIRNLAKNSTTGVGVQNLNVGAVREFMLPTPSLEEQKRIVAKLDNLFAKIDKAIALHQKNIDEADIFMASVLNDVFVELEENFQVKTLKDISNIISGYAFKSGDFSNDNKIKSIKITNVGVQNFVEEDDNFLPEELLNKLSKYTANYGDIAIALTRPYISNGLKVTYIPKTYDGAFINQRVAVIQSNEKFTSNSFIYHYLCTSNVLSNVMELSKTLNQPNLSIKDLSNFEIPLPPLQT